MSQQKTLKDFILAFAVPTLINKMFMLYFGLQYSKYPGEGYGYGLAATLIFLVASLGAFIWKYRHYEDFP